MGARGSARVPTCTYGVGVGIGAVQSGSCCADPGWCGHLAGRANGGLGVAGFGGLGDGPGGPVRVTG